MLIVKDSDIYKIARLWAKHSKLITATMNGKYNADVATEHNVAQLQLFINTLSNMTAASMNQAQVDAYNALKEYKTYILELPVYAISGSTVTVDGYSAAQIKACVDFDETAE